MKKITFLFLFTLLLYSTSLRAQNIVINEICPINYNSFEDDEDEHGDWVEFYNNGNSSIDLGGMFLTDNFSNLTKFQIPSTDPSETTIASHDYLIFWFDDETYKGETHANFKLDNYGERLALVASDSTTIIDSISFGALFYDVTFGRTSDGASTWSYFPNPTPDDNNTGGGFAGITRRPELSMSAGFYTSSLQVEIITYDSLATIYYTRNGNDPSPSNGILYTGPITINTNTVIRARVFKSNYFPGEIATRTFFINRIIDLPVISVVTDPLNLWDEDDGIYTFGVDDYDHFYPYYGANFWKTTKVPAHMEIFLANGAEVVSQNLNLSLSGNTSRVYAQKSLNLEAKDALGSRSIFYQLFPQLQINEFKSIKLRNGGADWSSTGIRDAFNHTLMEGAMDVDHQYNIPVILYLNGQYWGVMSMTEKLDEDYLKGHYPNINKDSVDILYSNKMVEKGDADNYTNMIDFIANNSLSRQSNYNYIKAQIDIPEFINYFESRIYYASTDWPNKNIKYWRPKDLSRKWRWIMWDTDRSDFLTTNPNHPCSYTHNTLEWATTNSSVAPWAQFLLNNLLLNSEFKSAFITQFAHHINFSFCPIRIDSVLDVFRSRLQNELPAHIARWSNTNDDMDYFTVGYYQSLAEWNTEVDTIKLFFDRRDDYVRDDIMNQFGISDDSHLSLIKNPPQGGVILIDTFQVPANACDLIYFDGYPVSLTAIANPGYLFAGWTNSSGDTLPLTWNPDGDTTVTAFFKLLPTQPNLPSSNITTSGSNCSNINLIWAPGNGEARIVVVKASSPVNNFPLDLISYPSDSIFGNGYDLGGGSYVVYSGTDSTCSISGLTAGVNYFIALIEFNGISGYSNYNTSNYLSFNTSIPVPQLFLGNDTIVCAENSLLLNAGIGFISYVWSTGDTTQSILADSIGNGLGLTTYFATVTNNSGCTASDTIDVTFDICSNVNLISMQQSISAFPNPFNLKLIIYAEEGSSIVTLFDEVGKVVFKKEIHSSDPVIHPEVCDGIYFLKIENKNLVKTIMVLKSNLID